MTQWLIDTLVAMTLLMALVLLIRGQVARLFGPNMAYALWLLPTARLFMPVVTKEVVLDAPSNEALAPSMMELSDFSSAALATTEASSLASNIDWLTVALVVWLGGAILLFLCKCAGYLQFRHDILSDAVQLDQIGSIKIIETAGISGPIAFGIIDKYVALPADFKRSYSQGERELAISHELAHHKSSDLLANMAGLLILSLHWFNPLAWAAWAAFRFDQETACDARVLKEAGHERRGAYGRAIAKSATGLSLGFASPLNPKNKIIERLKILSMSEKSQFRRKSGMIMLAAATAIALPLTATISYAVVEAPASAASPTSDVQSVPLPPSAPAAPLAPNAVAAPNAPAAPLPPAALSMAGSHSAERIMHITKLDNDPETKDGPVRVKRIKLKDGKTVVLRTTKVLSDAEARAMVIEAEQSRKEAHQELKEHRIEIEEARKEARQSLREHKVDRAEMKREMARVHKEAKADWAIEMKHVRKDMAEAMKEARAAGIKFKGYDFKGHKFKNLGKDFEMNFKFDEKAFENLSKMKFMEACDSKSKGSKKKSKSAKHCFEMTMPSQDLVLMSLKTARSAIQNLSGLSAEKKAEALRGLDAEIRSLK